MDVCWHGCVCMAEGGVWGGGGVAEEGCLLCEAALAGRAHPCMSGDGRGNPTPLALVAGLPSGESNQCGDSHDDGAGVRGLVHSCLAAPSRQEGHRSRRQSEESISFLFNAFESFC